MSKTKSQMDSKVGSSGSSSSASSSMDLKLKTSEKQSGVSKPSGGSISRSRRFFFCLATHIGRQRQQQQQQKEQQKEQQQQQQDEEHQLEQSRHQGKHQYKKKQRCKNLLAIYNSEDDIHSSSTDSFSLSYTHTPSCLMTGSSIDITGEERSSGTSSSASAYSRYSSAVFASESDDIWSKQQNSRRHFFIETMYRRPMTALGQISTDEYSSSNSSNNPDDNDNDNEEQNDNHRIDSIDGKPSTIDNATRITKEQKNNNNRKTKSNHGQQENNEQHKLSHPNEISNLSSKRSQSDTPPRSQSVSPCSIAKGLHLSRLSIASSVCRMFHQLTTTSTSTRSLSCSSTPFKEANAGSHSSRSRNSKNSSKKPTGSTTSSGSSSSKKKERKQQSILRPPVHYVYMKGMSGLYSRVPRYTTCCPYTTHQAA